MRLNKIMQGDSGQASASLIYKNDAATKYVDKDILNQIGAERTVNINNGFNIYTNTVQTEYYFGMNNHYIDLSVKSLVSFRFASLIAGPNPMTYTFTVGFVRLADASRKSTIVFEKSFAGATPVAGVITLDLSTVDITQLYGCNVMLSCKPDSGATRLYNYAASGGAIRGVNCSLTGEHTSYDELAFDFVLDVVKNTTEVPFQSYPPEGLTYDGLTQPATFWGNRKHYIDADVATLSRMRIGHLRDGFTGGDYKIMFYNPNTNTEVLVKTFIGAVAFNGTITLDLSDIVNVAPLIGCFVLVAQINTVGPDPIYRSHKYADSGLANTAVYTAGGTGVLEYYAFYFDFSLEGTTRGGQAYESRLVSQVAGLSNQVQALQAAVSAGLPVVTDLQDYINNNTIINLGAATYTVSAPITVPAGRVITGVMGKTIIKAANAGVAECMLLSAPTDIVISGITFEGFAAPTAVLNTITEVIARTGIGTQSGIYLTGVPQRVVISHCQFINFTRAGYAAEASMTFNNGPKIHDCFAQYCFIGFDIYRRAEYSQYSNLSANNCQVGAWVEAGNTLGTGWHCEQNRVGAVISGALSDNDSHGSISASTFNHNTLFSVVASQMHNGFSFNGCHIFDGNAYIYRSLGFNWVGGIFAAAVTVDGTGVTGVSASIQSTMFINASYGSGTITQIGAPTLLLKNNFYMGGESSAGINN